MDHVGEFLVCQRFRRDLISKVTAPAWKSFCIEQIIPVSICAVIQVIPAFLILIHQLPQHGVQPMVGKCHIQTVHFLCGRHFHFLASVIVRNISFPGLVPVGGCGSMVAVIHIKLYPIPGKSSRILHHILYAIHDDFCSYWNKRIRSIHGNGMAGCGIDTTCRRTAGPLPAADRTTAVTASYDLPQGFPHPHHLCFCHGFPCAFRGNAVLALKNFLHLILYLFIGKFPIFCRKVRNQVIRVVRDFINLIAVLVISRIAAFHAVDLFVQRRLQRRIRILHCINILVRTPISGTGNGRSRPTLDGSAAACHQGSDHHKEQHGCRRNAQDAFTPCKHRRSHAPCFRSNGLRGFYCPCRCLFSFFRCPVRFLILAFLPELLQDSLFGLLCALYRLRCYLTAFLCCLIQKASCPPFKVTGFLKADVSLMEATACPVHGITEGAFCHQLCPVDSFHGSVFLLCFMGFSMDVNSGGTCRR